MRGEEEKGFYWVNEYIYTGDKELFPPKHASPTMRLIKHKNSTWAHKQVMHDNGVDQRGSQYQLTYC